MPRRSVLKPVVWSLPAFRGTCHALDNCRALADTSRPLSVVTSPAGDGKTFAAEWYVANHPRRVRHIFVPPRDILTPRSLLDQVCRGLGMTPVGHRVAGLFDAIASHLAGNTTFLIMDEADRLRASNVDLLRELAEVGNAGICFLGCPGILGTLEYVPAAKHRVGFSYAVPLTEVEDLHKAFDDQFGVEVVDLLYDRTQGNLRHLDGITGLMAMAHEAGRPTRVTPALVKVTADRYLLGKVAA